MNTLKTILDTGIVAIARGIYGEELLLAVTAMYNAGVRAFEVAFEQNGYMGRTAEAISMLKRQLACAEIGAGTVLTTQQLMCAYNAGASYIVSPNVNVEIIQKTKELGLMSMPGAMTPSEIVLAHDAGADIVKLFPAGELGAGYFKAVSTPLAHINLAAVAGITLDNIRDFQNAGARAFGISSGLFCKDLIRRGDISAIERIASEYMKAIYEKNAEIQ